MEQWDTSYKRAEIKKFLYQRVKELKEYSKDEFKTLVRGRAGVSTE